MFDPAVLYSTFGRKRGATWNIEKKGGGLVHISVQRVQNGVKIVVRDNGAGIPKEKLHRLFGEDSIGVGLRNIEFRMRRHYGYGLEIESEKKRGTRVTILVPATDSRDHEE